MTEFLPMNRKEMEDRGWDRPDFVYVCGDAYVDHPSFGAAIITRLLESRGYRVAFLAQPDWRNEDSVREFGEPRLGFLVSAGNMDSMVNHYSVSKRRRGTDAYSPGGQMGLRPDRAVIVYSSLIRRVYPKVPIILGGIEASLRRMAHYDYWSDSLKRSVLVESQADLISYGMGERSIVEIAEALEAGLPVSSLTYIPGTVCLVHREEDLGDAVRLPSYEELKAEKRKYAESFYTQYRNTDPFSGKRLAEPYGRKLFVLQNPPAKPLTQMEMDDIYALPFAGTYAPVYEQAGGIPAIREVKFSLVSCRGCFGGCSFCALTFHQGRIIQTRSHESLLAEAKRMTQNPDFKGYIHDVGGPTANFRKPSCTKQLTHGVCTNRQCLFPKPCQNLKADHKDYLSLLRKLRKLPGVKKVFIRSGIRYDYVMADPDDTFLRELCEYHVSGQLKVAPEHVSDRVLSRMGKPEFSIYQGFADRYKKMNEKLGKKQYLVPYLISSHPGSTLKDAIALAEAVRDMGYMPEQVQDFYPTPSTISTCMYYTGLDPRTMEDVAIIRNPHQKAMQRALIQYRDPANYDLVREALETAGRRDLIGYGPHCLIRPEKPKGSGPKAVISGQKNSCQKAAVGSQKNSGQKGKVASGQKKNSRKPIRNIHKKK
ncbi:YgiQ family radical SAM protein [Lachnospiraceae bacterium CLA-AA-H215]|uniref:YgiQ family radical SAM protein n=1 Tax=Hominifimenecus microfluidus TaxID=2885348 RepID=A0AAE3EDU0_9FIRM|nr:YgiQ family radical SAM protein [Hominifimenecus microfluidus]MCC2232737.1 YgiQ family radical SAM protein [Hominifimenecus microfluidus]